MSVAASDRDLAGYGGVWPDVRWPNGARLAVSLVVNFEEGAERTFEAGDAAQEPVSEVRSVVPEGRRDLGVEQVFAYGLRAGVWRFLDALEKARLPATFFMCGRAAMRGPDAAAAVTAAGHEAACHGWLWSAHAAYADIEAERADLARAVAAIDAATGARPRGFFCRAAESPWTRTLLREAGFAYACNAFDDDLPYWDPGPGAPLLVLPYALDSNDMKFWHPNGFSLSDEFAQYVDDALTVLQAEAAGGAPRLLNIGFHLRISGRPGRFRAVQRILERLKGLGDDIWVARRIDIAAHWSARVQP